MSSLKPQLTYKHILSQLMAQRGWKERDLVKASGLPQTTVSNLLNGKTKNPQADTLKPIAEALEVTIGQLMGYESGGISSSGDGLTASSKGNKSLHTQEDALVPVKLPIIGWGDVKPWILGERGVKAHTPWLMNDKICKSPKAFALKAKTSMRAYFCSQFSYTDATLLVDPDAKVKDGLLVIVFLDDAKEPSLRLLTIDGDKKYLHAVETPNLYPDSDLNSNPRPNLKFLEKSAATLLTTAHSIIGPVMEVRYGPSIG